MRGMRGMRVQAYVLSVRPCARLQERPAREAHTDAVNQPGLKEAATVALFKRQKDPSMQLSRLIRSALYLLSASNILQQVLSSRPQ